MMEQDHAIVVEWWKLFKRYGNPPKTNADAFWDALVHDIDEMGAKYNDAPFVGDMLLAMVNEISRRAKTR